MRDELVFVEISLYTVGRNRKWRFKVHKKKDIRN